MNCKNAKEAICSYLDDLLNHREQVELNRHLEDCADCASYLEDLREGLNMLHELPLEEPSGNFEWNLKRKINEAVTEQTVLAKHRKRGTFWPQFSASAAAAMLLALSGAWLWYSGVMSNIEDIQTPHLDRSTVIVEDGAIGQPSVTPTSNGERLGPPITEFQIVGDQRDANQAYQGHSTIQPSRPEDMGPFLPGAKLESQSVSTVQDDSLQTLTDERPE